MTDKADDVKVQLFALVPSEMFVGRAWLSETAKDALHLINTQAAEIERLRFESDQLRHVKLGLEVQVMEQAAYIERLRGRIRIAEGTLVAWLREQGGGVDPVRHALATLRNMP